MRRFLPPWHIRAYLAQGVADHQMMNSYGGPTGIFSPGYIEGHLYTVRRRS